MSTRRGVNTATGTNSVTIVYTDTIGGSAITPNAGDLIRIAVTVGRNNTVPAQITNPDASKWTLMGDASGANAGNNASVHTSVFGRWADGTTNDNAPTISCNNGLNAVAIVEIISGLDSTAALPLQPTAPFTGSTVGNTATVTGNSITTSVANEEIWSVYGARTTASPSDGWGGGSTTDVTNTAFSTASTAAGVQTVATSGTTVTPAFTAGATSGGSAQTVMSFGFKPAGGAPTVRRAGQLMNA